MRSDYGLYGVAIICFIIAVVFGASAVPGYSPTEPIGITVIVIFLILGIIAAVVGYSARPKEIMPTLQPIPAPETPPPAVHIEEKVEEAPVAPPPAVEEVAAAPEPSPAPPTPVPEEPEKVEAIEETPEEKPVRRRRRKKTA